MERKVSLKFSGVGTNPLGRLDGKMEVKYAYIFSDPDKAVNGKQSYEKIIGDNVFDRSILLNYTSDLDYGNSRPMGVYNVQKLGGNFSIYKREYAEFKRGAETTEFIGPWHPVAVNIKEAVFRDFNVANNSSYQYIVHPINDAQKQTFANSDIEGGRSHLTGKPVETKWDAWSLIELIPQDVGIDAPIFKGAYRADIDNMWFFKYSLETGAQTQNINKSEIQTLGAFPKYSQSSMNFLSGSVSCLIGSEIVPYSEDGGYVERLWRAYNSPLSTNDKITMLNKWRSIVKSPNPKLLRDTKGQTWIVQIISSNNTPFITYKNQPDVISFEWRQIEDANNVLIYGAADDVIRNKCDSIWKRK